MHIALKAFSVYINFTYCMRGFAIVSSGLSRLEYMIHYSPLDKAFLGFSSPQ